MIFLTLFYFCSYDVIASDVDKYHCGWLSDVDVFSKYNGWPKPCYLVIQPAVPATTLPAVHEVLEASPAGSDNNLESARVEKTRSPGRQRRKKRNTCGKCKSNNDISKNDISNSFLLLFILVPRLCKFSGEQNVGT